MKCSRALSELFFDALCEIDLQQRLIRHVPFVCEHLQVIEH